MPFELMANRLGRLAERETRSIIVLPELPDRSLPEGVYTLHEMYCNERGCDCRRVFLNIQASFRPGPEAVVAWGWESRAFYARWLREADEATLDDLIGPALNVGSPATELAEPLLEKVTMLLETDEAYAARIQEHYRIWRAHIDGKRQKAGAAPGWFSTPPPTRRPRRR